LSAEELKAIRKSVLSEQEQLSFGLDTQAGRLRGWLPENAAHLVPPPGPIKTPPGVEGIAMHGCTRSNAKKIWDLLAKNCDIRNRKQFGDQEGLIWESSLLASRTDKVPEEDSGDCAAEGVGKQQGDVEDIEKEKQGDAQEPHAELSKTMITVTYTEGAKASVAGNLSFSKWSKRAAPGIPVYPEDLEQRIQGSSWKEHPLLSTEIRPRSGPASQPRPMSVPTGLWDNTSVRGTERLRSKMQRPKCTSQLHSDQKWLRDVPDSTFDIDGDGYVTASDLKIAKHIDSRNAGEISHVQQQDGKNLMAKELWEGYHGIHNLAQSPMTCDERKVKTQELYQLCEEPDGAQKFMKSYEREKQRRLNERERGSAGVIACVRKPQGGMLAKQYPAHCMTTHLKSRAGTRRAKTRTELFDARRDEMKESVRAIQQKSHIGGEIPRYGGNVMEAVKRQRDLITTHDTSSFRRRGGAFKEV